ncbi:MAG TPA: barstar family protein [Rhizomicrobium sp.]|nr:barstar family protein [Rhizomicrobium sp.]
MRTIELDASDWTTPVDFIRALQIALDAPEWCGSNVDAINELMIWGLGAGELPPPYVVKISKVSASPQEVQAYIALQAKCVREARAEKHARDGADTDVSIEIIC